MVLKEFTDVLARLDIFKDAKVIINTPTTPSFKWCSVEADEHQRDPVFSS